MTKKERAKVREAIDLLMDDAGHFQEALMILGGLVGIRFPAFEAMASKDFKAIDVRALAAGVSWEQGKHL